jgi:hypothetical protein
MSNKQEPVQQIVESAFKKQWPEFDIRNCDPNWLSGAEWGYTLAQKSKLTPHSVEQPSGTRRKVYQLIDSAKHKAVDDKQYEVACMIREVETELEKQLPRFTEQAPSVDGELLEALKDIERACDNNNPTHEDIWHRAYDAITKYEGREGSAPQEPASSQEPFEYR